MEYRYIIKSSVRNCLNYPYKALEYIDNSFIPNDFDLLEVECFGRGIIKNFFITFRVIGKKQKKM